MKEFLSEKGKRSMMRVLVLAVVVVALFVVLFQVVKRPEHSFDYVGVSTLLAVAFGSKIIQKPFEK